MKPYTTYRYIKTLYVKFHEDLSINVDIMAIIIVKRGCVCMRAISESIWLIFIEVLVGQMRFRDQMQT